MSNLVLDNEAAKDLRVPRRPVSKSPMSEECLALAETWLKNCTENHSCFSATEVPLPTRVIDCGSSVDPSLLITEGSTGLYVTLSHCWGSKPTLTTTKDQLAAFRKGIPWTTIPKSFQDAIKVTRTLGIRYSLFMD